MTIRKGSSLISLTHNLVNDRVPRHKFYGKDFNLRFPSVDTIVEKIVTLTDYDPVLYKMDIARAFRNIKVDPIDAVKLGIYWKGQYFLDPHTEALHFNDSLTQLSTS